jgi:hypothetical protein
MCILTATNQRVRRLLFLASSSSGATRQLNWFEPQTVRFEPLLDWFELVPLQLSQRLFNHTSGSGFKLLVGTRSSLEVMNMHRNDGDYKTGSSRE